VCAFESQRSRRYFQSLLHEFVNDPHVRSALMRSKGYCHRHAHLLLEFRDGLGTAILYHDQVEGFCRFLGTLAGGSSTRSRAKASSRWKDRETCPACRQQWKHRGYFVETLVAGLREPDPDMVAAWEKCPGLCVPHFLVALDEDKEGGATERLVAHQARRFSALLEELEEFCRKQDYRFRGEPPGKEVDSWRRAVEMMTGNRGLF
jgi:hypothetical protein